MHPKAQWELTEPNITKGEKREKKRINKDKEKNWNDQGMGHALRKNKPMQGKRLLTNT